MEPWKTAKQLLREQRGECSQDSTNNATQSRELTHFAIPSLQRSTASDPESNGSKDSSNSAQGTAKKSGTKTTKRKLTFQDPPHSKGKKRATPKLKRTKAIRPSLNQLMDLEAEGLGDANSSQSQDEDPTSSDQEFIDDSEQDGGPPPCADALFPGTITPGDAAEAPRGTFGTPTLEEDGVEFVQAQKPKKKYNYQALGHFLTYPGITGDFWTKERVMTCLKMKMTSWGREWKEIMVAQEEHHEEAAEEGSYHFHCWIKLDGKTPKNVYADTWDLFIEEDNHDTHLLHGNYQAARSPKNIIKYIAKDGDYLTEGDFDPEAYMAAVKGKRSYAGELVIKEGKAGLMRAVRANPELMFDYEKLCRATQQWERDCAAAELTYDGPTQWRPFQEELIEILSGEPDKRKCFWITDKQGGTGKSTLARYLCLEKGAILLDEGRGKDTLFGYGGQRIVLIDLPRDTDLEGADLYSNIERLKNAHYYCGKYAGEMRIYKIPHVVVFANWDPNTTKLSPDRWEIWRISGMQEDVEGQSGGEIMERSDGFGRTID